MPTIVRLHQCVIRMYFGDHLPPHFHVVDNNGDEALVSLDGLTVLAGGVSRSALREALQWAGDHRQMLEDAWNQFN